jgi:serine/threonine-protein kinase RsbW
VARRRSDGLRAALRAICEAWDGRSVPAVLFDAAAFAARYERAAGGALLEELPGEEDRIRLPRVAAAASGRIGVSTSPAGLEMDAVAWGWRDEPGDPEGEVAWAVRCLPGGAGSSEALRELDRDVGALQAAGDLPGERVVRWAVLDAPLDAAGAAAAAELRIATSTLPGLRALAAVLGVAVRVPDPVRRGRREVLEFELTLPAAADAELVAARALEQIGETAALPAEEVGRVRTALIEACINAFEHGGSPGARVRLVFSVAGDELRIRVENRGRPLAVAAGSVGTGVRRRGWGLRLMRELMDSVELEPREDGVTLVMTKRIAAGEAG